MPARKCNPDNPYGMSNQEYDWAQAFIDCRNASEASRRIGLTGDSAKTMGNVIRHRPNVKMFIKEQINLKAKQHDFNRDKILKELCLLAFSNIEDLIEEDESGNKQLKSFDEIASGVTAAIESFEIDGKKTKIKMASKLKALELLGKTLALYHDVPAGAEGENPILNVLQALVNAQNASKSQADAKPSKAKKKPR